MKVTWHMPDDSTLDSVVSDVEQFLFLLRLVHTVKLRGETYEIHGPELVVDEDQLSISVKLLYP
jgi:hypothetical protein